MNTETFVIPQIKTADSKYCCFECHKIINPGDWYEHISSTEKSKIYRTCIDCMSLKDTFFKSYRIGQIWDDFFDYHCYSGKNIPEDGIVLLTPAARDKVCEWIECEWIEEG